MPDLTADYVRSILDYDPETGLMVWKIKPNSARAGTIAGTVTDKGYRSIYINDKKYLAHRLIWLMQTGEWPPREIDHKDRNGPKRDYGNRWTNLRLATRSQNAQNQKMRSDNTSGHVGVYWGSELNKWVAHITFEGKEIPLGYYLNFEDAVAVRQNAEKTLFGVFASS
jgi:HNH endonuclease